MPHVPAWEKTQEVGPPGKFSLLGDASVRFVGPGLMQIVNDIASHVRYRSLSDVIVGPADAPGWKPIRPGQYSWAWQGRRPRQVGGAATPGTQGAMAILIGLLLPLTEPHALGVLRPLLIPGARLHLIAGHNFTSASHVPASFNGYDAGFTGGVVVATS